MNFEIHRPGDHKGQGDAALPRLIRDLKKVLLKPQNKFAYDPVRLPTLIVEDVAHLLVEFGEDLHNDLGLWRGRREKSILSQKNN